jgi:hypothetical protein
MNKFVEDLQRAKATALILTYTSDAWVAMSPEDRQVVHEAIMQELAQLRGSE